MLGSSQGSPLDISDWTTTLGEPPGWGSEGQPRPIRHHGVFLPEKMSHGMHASIPIKLDDTQILNSNSTVHSS
jgi:hypothetical protein